MKQMYIYNILIPFLPGSFEIEQFLLYIKCRLMFSLFSQYFQLKSENNNSTEAKNYLPVESAVCQ